MAVTPYPTEMRCRKRMLERTMNVATDPILTSILDTDAYKFHMQQTVFHRYYDVTVSAEFRCRGDDLLGEYAADISAQIEMMRSLKLDQEEFAYRRGLSFFQSDYFNWLRQFRFNPSQVRVRNHHGKFDIRITGPWRDVILWEVLLLAVISEVVHRRRSPQIAPADAVAKLRYFRHLSADVDMSRFRPMDFGTRRRFSRQVQFDVVAELQRTFPYLIGTSNYQLARECGLPPVGTQAHSADKPRSGQQPAHRAAGLAGRIPRPVRDRAHRLHHDGCLFTRLRAGVRPCLSGPASRLRRPGGMGREGDCTL